MANIQIWKVITDVLLLASIVILCVRFARASRSASNFAKMTELDSTLRALIKEADGSSRTLNDQLLKRQQSLERLLGDLQSVEGRLDRTLSSAEESRGILELEVTRAQKIIDREFPDTPPLKQNTHEPAASAGYTPQRPATQAADTTGFEPIQVEATDAPPRWGKTNIYGEPIAPLSPSERTFDTTDAEERPAKPRINASKASAYKASSLASNIEKEVQRQPRTSAPAAFSENPAPPSSKVEDIYAAAEELLKAGKDLEYVSFKTRLPIEEVRLLSQLVIQEKASAEPRRETPEKGDPRLGVLGMKRQVQTV